VREALHLVPGVELVDRDAELEGNRDERVPRLERVLQPQPHLRAGEREFFIDNLLVRIYFIIVMIRWTGLAPWEFELPPGACTAAPAAPVQGHLAHKKTPTPLGSH